MAKSQSGKRVSQAASTGGGRSYRAQRPTNYYAAIALIVVLGLVSVFWARSQYHSSASATTAPGVPPTVGSTSYAALAFDVCGSLEPSLLPSSLNSTQPITAQGSGVVKIAPKTASQSGTNASLALFASGYPGLSISSTSLSLPANAETAAVKVSNGQKCPAGTPDAGKPGTLLVNYWKNFATTTPQTTTDPKGIHFTPNSLITVSFLAAGSKAIKPSSATIQAMLKLSAAPVTTSTSVPITIPPSVPTTTTPKK